MGAKSNKKIRVLVTGAGGPAGIVALRLLKKLGGVHAVGADIDPLASGQLFADEYVTMAPVFPTEGYHESMRDLVAKHEIDIVIPTVHEELPYVHGVLEGVDVHYVVSPQETLELGDDKEKFFAWAQAQVPDYTPAWQPAYEPLRLSDEVLFVKPSRGRGGRGCRTITPDEIAFIRERFPDEAKKLLVFEYLPGTEWTVDAYIRTDGTPAYIVPRERIGVSGGISIKGRTVRHDEVIERTRALIAALPMLGPVCIQWKADREGIPKLVEVNPRLGGGTLIGVAAGVDPIRCLVDELSGKTIPSIDWQEVTVVGWLDYENTRHRGSSR